VKEETKKERKNPEMEGRKLRWMDGRKEAVTDPDIRLGPI